MKSNKLFWNKKGRILEPNKKGFTHCSHPTVTHFKNNIFLIAFTQRDENKRSNIFMAYIKVNDKQIEIISEPKLVLKPGDYGHFDSDGAISSSFIKHKDKTYLYYVGWQNLPPALWTGNTGRVVVDLENLSLKKEFAGPVFSMDKNNPIFAAATGFYIDKNEIWHTWYLSGLKWENIKNEWKLRYAIFHATSTDGIDWNSDKEQCIPFLDDKEYAFGRPSVIKDDDYFHMWYGHREVNGIDKYRMGYSKSKDGLSWLRDDKNAGITVSEKGWDSEMICYPFVFSHNGSKFMLYNGNDYGLTGFGYAVQEII